MGMVVLIVGGLKAGFYCMLRYFFLSFKSVKALIAFE